MHTDPTIERDSTEEPIAKRSCEKENRKGPRRSPDDSGYEPRA